MTREDFEIHKRNARRNPAYYNTFRGASEVGRYLYPCRGILKWHVELSAACVKEERCTPVTTP